MGIAEEEPENKTVIIIVDSDGFIGSLNTHDFHHKICHTILLKFSEKKAQFIYPATVIIETVTLLQGRLNQPELADQVIQTVKANQIFIEPIDVEILQKASILIDLKRSKHNTLFDAVVASIAKKYDADAIFSFDRFYKRVGFKLAEDML
ncbi:type II toxin-antitoxin system VapC family toxin [Candidatus Gottesmanbacteria bacterium]|nr:type II toxin-antitoxin system VapC family toxin [Candidatus Gottesmanbacteria bacterium]